MIQIFRSLLFVPGARPERFDKAVGTDADTIIIDLEDAVLPDQKDTARAAALSWLGARKAGAIAGLRINSPRSADGCADIAALAAGGVLPDFIMVPKAETSIDMEIVREALGLSLPLMAVIESGRALGNAYDVAGKADGGVLFGGADFSASLGADLANWDAMLTARGTIAAACAAAGVPAYDVPFLDVKDEAGLIVSTGRAKLMGFSGRACIHPSQVDPVNGVFSPSEAEFEDARAIIKSLADSGGGAVLHKGKLVDRPVILAAQRTLAKAGKQEK
ncbi:CoA ester lyase [Hyphomonas sp.]|jgi:citrate lyase subunit beta/citryl-CoA lyase/(S)-citramalyl-CoA lyase|uniref:HpcH/HpaI aldolase/citrate lyase family protein n=1 Tax=Hyphomonas sp. TaxID=87 RepID=UPI001DD3F321|nr:CoA ester lyase [Hyphomonas sp.]